MFYGKIRVSTEKTWRKLLTVLHAHSFLLLAHDHDTPAPFLLVRSSTVLDLYVCPLWYSNRIVCEGIIQYPMFFNHNGVSGFSRIRCFNAMQNWACRYNLMKNHYSVIIPILVRNRFRIRSRHDARCKTRRFLTEANPNTRSMQEQSRLASVSEAKF